MKTFFLILLSFFYCTKIHSQDILQQVKDQLATDLKKKINDPSWTIKIQENTIVLMFTDTFYRNSWISPLNNSRGFYNSPDTIGIVIKLENGWTIAKRDSISKKQHLLIDVLTKRYIAYQDSLKWKNTKSDREMFLESPYRTLQNWEGTSLSERLYLEHLNVLPDTIINNVGLFVDINYMPSQEMLEPEHIREKVNQAYLLFSQVLGRRALYKTKESY